MSPDQFDALMDLIDHKIATALRFGKFSSNTLSAKQGRVKQMLTAQNESAATSEPVPNAKTRSDLEDDLRRLLEHKGNVEQADDQCYTNGRMREINEEIAKVRAKLDSK